MNRQILLVEPNYKNKYPPMGLMKLSTYYKRLGDHVTFFKGNLIDLVLDDTFEMLKEQLYANDSTIFWEQYKPQICQYGVTTLFTFYWDIAIETINFAKRLCKTDDGVMVGGIMVSILADRIEAETGIKPHIGTLHTPDELDPGNGMIIDTLPLDYSILEEIDYQYPVSDAYFAYMTRGCVNKCKFCAVPKLEPVYTEFLPVSEQVHLAEQRYRAKRDLLLLDNNVLASCRFNDIVDDIIAAGFGRNATYISPNLYEIAVQNLRSGHNDRGYIKSCVRQFRLLLDKVGRNQVQSAYDLLNWLKYQSDLCG